MVLFEGCLLHAGDVFGCLVREAFHSFIRSFDHFSTKISGIAFSKVLGGILLLSSLALT